MREQCPATGGGASKETLLNRQQGREESRSEKECRREVVLGGYYKNPE
jgi:hypothetical protein